MNRSDIRAMRERLQARQAESVAGDSPAWEIAGAAAFALFILVVMFV